MVEYFIFAFLTAFMLSCIMCADEIFRPKYKRI